MLKKMRRRFILAAMAAFGTVMAMLLAGINLVNFYRTTSVRDQMAANLLGREQRAFHRPQAPLPPMEDMPGGGRRRSSPPAFSLPTATRRGASCSSPETISPP